MMHTTAVGECGRFRSRIARRTPVWTLIWRSRAPACQITERRYELTRGDDDDDENSRTGLDAELEVWESELAWLRSCLRGSGLILLDGAYAGETE